MTFTYQSTVFLPGAKLFWAGQNFFLGILPAGKEIFGNLGKNFLHFPFKNAINFCSQALASRLASLGFRNYRFRAAGAVKPAKNPDSRFRLKKPAFWKLSWAKKNYSGKTFFGGILPAGKRFREKKQCLPLTFCCR